MQPRIMFRTAVIMTLLLGGCVSTQRISTRPVLEEECSDQRTLTILTGDSLVELQSYRCTDSTLIGTGTVRRADALETFDGELSLADVTYIESHHFNGFRTILALSAGGFVLGSAISILQENDGGPMSANAITGLYDPRYRPSSGGGGSCPTIYSWNGSHPVLEGEAFAVAWGSAFEMTTTTLLPSLRISGDSLRVEVRNERPETHYHNALTLLSADILDRERVVVDTDNRLCLIGDLLPPAEASDGRPGSVLAALSARDSVCWQSSLASAVPGGSFLDRIQIRFDAPATGEAGALVVTATNTDIFPVMMSHLADLLGESTLDFVSALEHDPEMIGLVRQWLDEAALRVMVGNGTTWKEAGRILPEASAVPFTRAIILDLKGIGENVYVKLECLADVWKLDAVGLDRAGLRVVPWIPVNTASASTRARDDVFAPLSAVDEEYVITLPSEVITMVFHDGSAQTGHRKVYGLKATGYLHEWIPDRPESTVASFVPRSGRLQYLKTLLQHRDILLPPIYARWKLKRDDGAYVVYEPKR
jgi:hypothetical protein